jgi:hypothetical protein
MWRFIHMLSHIPLGFGEPQWAVKFHDWTAKRWDESGYCENCEERPATHETDDTMTTKSE